MKMPFQVSIDHAEQIRKTEVATAVDEANKPSQNRYLPDRKCEGMQQGLFARIRRFLKNVLWD
ncbi:hypothetical protein [Agrobacterium deltaense]|uniref:hypothetical protein n=1 Tax=Agrobacterium deltaense TaxID=1183412 RepID=UPI0009BC2263|nr:hypothetical protein [Agrobacterium deltaense]